MKPSSSLNKGIRVKFLRLNVHHNKFSLDSLFILDGRHTEITLQGFHKLLDIVSTYFEALEVS